MPTVVRKPYSCELCGDPVELVRGCWCGHHAGCDWLEPDGAGGFVVVLTKMGEDAGDGDTGGQRRGRGEVV